VINHGLPVIVVWALLSRVGKRDTNNRIGNGPSNSKNIGVVGQLQLHDLL
jgi:hypothetical protein